MSGYPMSDNYYVIAVDDDVWEKQNLLNFVEFCSKNVGNDIVLDVFQESPSLTHIGLYRVLDSFSFNSVTINVANALEQHDRYIVNNTMWSIWVSRNLSELAKSAHRKWNRKTLFGCVYGRPQIMRVLLTSYMHKFHRDITSMYIRYYNEPHLNIDFTSLAKIGKQHLANYVEFAQMKYQYSVDIPAYDLAHGYDWENTALTNLYEDFLIDIVVEPNVYGDVFYPTEKIGRAMQCKRPFILMGPKNMLQNLRNIGFQTFSDVWDESYDNYYESDRIYRILRLIDSLSTMDRDLLEKQTTAIVEHNYNLFCGGLCNLGYFSEQQR